jgi:hypothetical protein
MCEKRNPTMIFATDFFFSTKTLYLCFLIFLSTIFAIFAIFNYSDLLEQIVPTAKHENVVNRFFLFAIDYYDLVLIEVNRLIVTLAHRPKLKQPNATMVTKTETDQITITNILNKLC